MFLNRRQIIAVETQMRLKILQFSFKNIVRLNLPHYIAATASQFQRLTPLGLWYNTFGLIKF